MLSSNIVQNKKEQNVKFEEVANNDLPEYTAKGSGTGTGSGSDSKPKKFLNEIPNLIKKINFFVVFIVLIIILLTFLVLFYPPANLFSKDYIPLQDQQIIANVFIIVFFVIIIFGLLIYYLPALSDVKKFMGQFKTVMIVILYTIFLILLYRLMPVQTMNKYTYIITPLTMVMTVFLFYNGFKKSYVKDFNVNYERIKTVILYVCFISILFVYYTCNTGGFVQYYFGPTLLITMLLALFAFLYVIIILTVPDSESKNSLNKGSFLKNFSKFSVYGSIGFVIYLVISIIGFMYLNGDLNQSSKKPSNANVIPTSIQNDVQSGIQNVSNTKIASDASNVSSAFNSYLQDGSFLDFSFLKVGGKEYTVSIPLLTSFITNYDDSQYNSYSPTPTSTSTSTSTSTTEGFEVNSPVPVVAKNGSQTLAIIFILFTTFIFGTTLIMNIFPENVEYITSHKADNIHKLSLFKRALLMLLGIVISGLIIAWLVYYIQSLSTDSGIVSFILNLLLVLVILTLLYKTFNVKTPSNHANAKKNAFFSLLINLLLYIPCLFSEFFDSIVTIFTGKEYSNTTTSILLIVIAIVLFVLYIKLPSLEEKIASQGGQLIVNRPVTTTNLSPLATYAELNGNNDFNYEFGLSFWFYIDAMPPNTNPSYTTYTSILNYGNKPNISYNASENKLRVTMELVNRFPYVSGLPGNKKELQDVTEEKIIFEKENVLLQKWNNIIINYSGGTLDVFLNNDLLKSAIGVVPYMVNDALTIGAENGLFGGVCNVVYFKQPLTSSQIFYLYNMVKDKTPPISDNSTKTIISDKSIISTTN